MAKEYGTPLKFSQDDVNNYVYFLGSRTSLSPEASIVTTKSRHTGSIPTKIGVSLSRTAI